MKEMLPVWVTCAALVVFYLAVRFDFDRGDLILGAIVAGVAAQLGWMVAMLLAARRTARATERMSDALER